MVLTTHFSFERYGLRKDATLTLNHPNGTHDDVFWSIALAAYATVDMKEFDLDALRVG